MTVKLAEDGREGRKGTLDLMETIKQGRKLLDLPKTVKLGKERPLKMGGRMAINENCPCKRKKCERHGKCAECRKHHAESNNRRPVYCEKKGRNSKHPLDKES